MQRPGPCHQTLPIARPVRGGSTRVLVGRLELVLEHARTGGLLLLVNDGRSMRRWNLPLHENAQLRVEHRAPRFPVRVALTPPLVLPPGQRRRGFVVVPVVPTIVWQRIGQPAEIVAELLPRGLVGEWRDDACVVCCTASWQATWPEPSPEPHVVVAVHLRNRSAATWSVDELPFTLRDTDVVELRQRLVARPVRVQPTSDLASTGVIA